MHCHQTNPDIHSTNPILKLTQIYSHNTRLPSKINCALPEKRTEFDKKKNCTYRTIDMAEHINRTQIIKLCNF